MIEQLKTLRDVLDLNGSATLKEALTALAQQCGATVYRHRMTPQSPALAFGDQAWAKFCQAVAAQQPQAEAVPPTHVLVPVEVLKAASESLGNFVSDHGWTDADMQAMDNLDAIIAQQKGGA